MGPLHKLIETCFLRKDLKMFNVSRPVEGDIKNKVWGEKHENSEYFLTPKLHMTMISCLCLTEFSAFYFSMKGGKAVTLHVALILAIYRSFLDQIK